MTCKYCDDGDGFCAFPYYGVAPHEWSEPGVSRKRILPKEQWPENFEQDKDTPGCGTYTHCPECGDGDKP